MGGHSSINVGDGDVIRAAKDVAATKDVLRGKTQDMHNKLNDLKGQWEGRGEVAFQNAIVAWKRTADRVTNALDDFHDQLTGADTTYEETETGVETRLNKYSTGLG